MRLEMGYFYGNLIFWNKNKVNCKKDHAFSIKKNMCYNYNYIKKKIWPLYYMEWDLRVLCNQFRKVYILINSKNTYNRNLNA